jgi:hypothetical protein
VALRLQLRQMMQWLLQISRRQQCRCPERLGRQRQHKAKLSATELLASVRELRASAKELVALARELRASAKPRSLWIRRIGPSNETQV